MAHEYYTATFANDSAGIAHKNVYSTEMAQQGWSITSESIEPGHIKGGEACCGFLLCAPLAFLAGRTPGYIVVTFAREQVKLIVCKHCGAQLASTAVFCRDCGRRLLDEAPPLNAP